MSGEWWMFESVDEHVVQFTPGNCITIPCILSKIQKATSTNNVFDVLRHQRNCGTFTPQECTTISSMLSKIKTKNHWQVLFSMFESIHGVVMQFPGANCTTSLSTLSKIHNSLK
jgi:hypothetical protein